MSGVNNYDYIQVDPKVIQMLGGSDDMADPMGEDFGADLPSNVVESYSSPKKGRNVREDFNPNFSAQTILPPDPVPGLLQEILNELREIKTIIAGR